MPGACHNHDMGDDARVPVRAVLYHDFDQRWRIVIEDADGDELRSILLPAETDGIRSAVRGVRERLRAESLDVGELVPVDAEHDTWSAAIMAGEPAARIGDRVS